MISEILDMFSEIDGSMVIFLMIFSMAVAIFHTVLFGLLFKIKFSKWLFFVLNPALIGVSYLIHKPLAGVAFIFLFASVFILAFIGIPYEAVNQYLKERKKSEHKTPWWKVILKILVVLVLFGIFIFLGPYAIILILAYIIISKFLPNPTNRFLQLQSVLPTSSIRSMAMGLVEVKGKIKKAELLSSPMESKPCVGYRYVIENERTDDGKKHYTTIKDITVCNDFYLYDTTGETKIKGKDLQFLWVEIADRHTRSGMRYTQYLLKEGQEVLLIGKASTEGQETIIEKEKVKDIFMIAPVESINRWNKYKPLLQSFIVMNLIIAILTICILLSDISVDGNTVRIKLNNIRFDWNELFNRFTN